MKRNNKVLIKNLQEMKLEEEIYKENKPVSQLIKITQYAGMKKPAVEKTILIETVLKIIREGDENLNQIQKAREFGKGTLEYDKIKSFKLPTFRFSFLFDGFGKIENIIAPTGLIYLDADYLDVVPESEYVYAKWRSLSNKGFGILVKVDNLTKDNFREVYNELSKLIGIKADPHARKPNQQTVLSYDPNLYHNNDSKVYHYIEEIKKVSYVDIIKEKKEGIVTNDTLINTNSSPIKFDNIRDYFTDDTPYIVFEEYVDICKIFIRKRYTEGNRNNTMYILLSQLAILNKEKDNGFLLAMGRTINNKMYPKLSEYEFKTILDNVVNQRNKGNLQLILNSKRKILFNPFLNLTNEYKRSVVGNVLGDLRKEKTRAIIYQVLEDWDFDKEGKITQQKVSKQAEKGITTIKRYWKEFQDYINSISENLH